MRKFSKLFIAWIVVLFLLLDSSYMFCLHSSLLNIGTFVEGIVSDAHCKEDSHDKNNKNHHDPFHDIYHSALNIVDTSVNIESPFLNIMSFLPDISEVNTDLSFGVFVFPLLYLQQKFKFPTLKSRLYIISSLLI